MKKAFLKFFMGVMIFGGVSLISCETDSTTGADDDNTIDLERTDDTTRGMERGTPAGGQSEGSLPDGEDN